MGIQKTHPGFLKNPLNKNPRVFGFLWVFLKIIKISHSNLRIKPVFTQRLSNNILKRILPNPPPPQKKKKMLLFK